MVEIPSSIFIKTYLKGAFRIRNQVQNFEILFLRFLKHPVVKKELINHHKMARGGVGQSMGPARTKVSAQNPMLML